jgi:hypothetical protein
MGGQLTIRAAIAEHEAAPFATQESADLAPTPVAQKNKARRISKSGVAMYAAAIAIRIPTMTQSLTIWHGWRQTQTAYTALIFQQSGIDLLRPQVPVLGRPGVLVYELPLFQAMGSMLASFGVEIGQALRWTSLFWFIVTALLLRAILLRVSNQRIASAAQFVFLFNPYGLFWSRAALIEYLATALALGYVLCGLRWRQGGRAWNLVFACFLAATAALVKSTTAFVWIVPLAVTMLCPNKTFSVSISDLSFVKKGLAFCCLVSSIGIAGTSWTVWADHVKSTPLLEGVKTGGALSNSKSEWPYLFTMRVWAKPWAMVVNNQIGGLVIFVVILAALFVVQGKMWWWSLAAIWPFAVFVFPVQYRFHEYYVAAISPAVAALVALAFDWVLSSSVAKAFPKIVRRSLLAPLWAVMAFVAGSQSIHQLVAGNDDPVFQNDQVYANELRAHTSVDELIGAIGLSWSPIPFYEARRRGAVMPEGGEVVFGREFRDGNYHALLIDDSMKRNLDVLKGWAWLSSVSQHLIRIEDHRQNGAKFQSAFVSAKDKSSIPVDKIFGRASLKCDGTKLSLPRSRKPLALWFRQPNSKQRLVIDPSTAALPIRDVAVVSEAAFPKGQREMECLGGGQLEIDMITETH